MGMSWQRSTQSAHAVGQLWSSRVVCTIKSPLQARQLGGVKHALTWQPVCACAVMSANERTETVFECIRGGAEDYLLKPVTRKEVQHMWQHVWRRQQQSALRVPHFCAEEVRGSCWGCLEASRPSTQCTLAGCGAGGLSQGMGVSAGGTTLLQECCKAAGQLCLVLPGGRLSRAQGVNHCPTGNGARGRVG